MGGGFKHIIAALDESDPGLREAVEDQLARLAKTLGESPEAWRGAEAVADEFVAALGAPIAAGRDPMSTAQPMIVYVMALATALSMHPMTPWARSHPDG